MGTIKRPRKGSLQFYPRKRAAKFLHRVNWNEISKSKNLPEGLLGCIAYKAGMTTTIVKDKTPKVMSSEKQIAMPVTILEVPAMKIFSVRFYQNGIVLKDIIVSNDKELKRLVRIPKTLKNFEESIPKEFDDVRVVVHSMPKQTSIKKTPDMIELAVNSSDKISYIKSLVGKEISLSDIKIPDMVDVRGLTKGYGFSGPVKRFGIKLKFHKSEKGVRRPGSLGPWHPHHVTFKAPMAGQHGLFSRTINNLHVVQRGKISESNINPKSGFKNYGNVQTSYVIISGSVPGPVKRQLVITPAQRPSKIQTKKKFEFIEVSH